MAQGHRVAVASTSGLRDGRSVMESPAGMYSARRRHRLKLARTPRSTNPKDGGTKQGPSTRYAGAALNNKGLQRSGPTVAADGNGNGSAEAAYCIRRQHGRPEDGSASTCGRQSGTSASGFQPRCSEISRFQGSKTSRLGFARRYLELAADVVDQDFAPCHPGLSTSCGLPRARPPRRRHAGLVPTEVDT